MHGRLKDQFNSSKGSIPDISRSEADISTEGKNPNRWITWYRPASYWEVVIPHLLLAAVTGIPLLVSFIIPLSSIPMIPCTFLKLTGYPCPFCGFTRSFWATSGGNWTYAIWNAPLSIVIYTGFVGVFIVNFVALIAGVRIRRGKSLIFNSRQRNWITLMISLLFLLNWVYRLILGLK